MNGLCGSCAEDAGGGGSDLGVDVHQGQSHPEEDTAAALQEEDVPHAQAALQRQAVDKDAEEPVGADAGHIHPVPLQVGTEAREPHVHQLFEHQLVHLPGAHVAPLLMLIKEAPCQLQQNDHLSQQA